MKQVGIDALAVYVPRLYVDLTDEWATVRAPQLGEASVEQLIGKVTKGVGVQRMAVADAHEDSATMAAMAAKQVIEQAGIDPRDIDFLAVGTETTVDQSKSISGYVLGMLEQYFGVELGELEGPQFQSACMGTTYALAAAANRIRAGENHRPYALVIATDIAHYPLRTPGEYTQGAGAVALLIREEPRLLVLDPGLMSMVVRDERDFFRPNWSQTAVVDGKYSINVYLDCIEAAWQQWAARWERLDPEAAAKGPADEQLDYLLFHVPFPRMAEYAAARILGTSVIADSMRRQELPAELADVAGLADDPQRRAVWERQFTKTTLFRRSFDAKVEPSLTLARSIGNIYTGSLYLALASLLTSGGHDLAGRRIGMLSYGSGASAAVFSGHVPTSFRGIDWNLDDHLAPEAEGGRRVPLSVASYEALHGRQATRLAIAPAVQAKLDEGAALSADDSRHLAEVLAQQTLEIIQPGPSVVPAHNEFALVRLGTEQGPQRTDWGYRYYEWVAAQGS